MTCFRSFARSILLNNDRKSKKGGKEIVHSTSRKKGSKDSQLRTRKTTSLPSAKQAESSISTSELTEDKRVERSIRRFAEQGWSLVYYTCFWIYGMYIHFSLPSSFLHPSHFWTNYPHIPLAAPVKWYYLLQLASWVNQIVILNVEAPRKDHIQMFTHHVVTIALIVASYVTNFTRVGCAIMVLMDLCDILLPLAKMFLYASFSNMADIFFVVFLVAWLVTRQLFYFVIAFSIVFQAPWIIPYQWDPASGRYLTWAAQKWFAILIWTLGALLCGWFYMICGVAYKFVQGAPAEDSRSDDED
jgi:acyl-CoA-dependent ceramide synthase